MPLEQASSKADSLAHGLSLQQRCRELDLFFWLCNDQGAVSQPPEETGPVGQWLGSPALHHHIESAVKAYAAEPPPEAVELFEGCWAVVFKLDHHSASAGVGVALAVTPRALESERFEQIAAEAALDSHQARQAWEPFVRHGVGDLPYLAKVLRWCSDDLVQTGRDTQAIDEFSAQLLQSYEEANFHFLLARLITDLSNPAETLQTICKQLKATLPFRWVMVRFNQQNNCVADELAGRFFVAGTLPCGEKRLHAVVDDMLTQQLQQRWVQQLNPATSELARLSGAEVIAEPIYHQDEVAGCLLAGNKEEENQDASSQETQFLEAVTGYLAVFHENIFRFEQQQKIFYGTIRAFTSSIDAKDNYTHGHSERVALMSAKLAQAMGISEQECKRVHISGLLHDIGKIGVPEAVLCKTGRLTAEEFTVIKKHPTIGYNILKGIPSLLDTLSGVLYHHERWDGRGYPEGLKGHTIPLMGRVLALADAFDAMSSDRSYRSAMTREKVLSEIREGAGTQFDPELAKLFLALDLTEYDQMILAHQAGQFF